jgi:hypothetical protein
MNRFNGSWLRRQATGVFFAGCAVLAASYTPGCVAQDNSAHGNSARANQPVGTTAQPSYRSPEDAVGELYSALQNGDAQVLRKVLGGDDELVSSGNAAADQFDRQQIVQKYQEMHRLAPQSNGTMVLFIGAENWPFPIPLVSSNSAWRFDPAAGAQEIRLRQIGEDEVSAMEMCHALAQTQLGSGVYVDTSNQEDEEAGSLLNTLLARSPDRGEPALYHGYYFRVVAKSRDGLTAVAYPAAYGTSGFMTFVVTGRDVVYENDLGSKGEQGAQAMRRVRLDSTWRPAD